ncbi:MAG TPA: hypothetical protein VNT55_09455, partial [Baekduia sp.]|nr:hypothetical protein [Baekduia sp.]
MDPCGVALDARRGVRRLHRVGHRRALGRPEVAIEDGVVVDLALGTAREDPAATPSSRWTAAPAVARAY